MSLHVSRSGRLGRDMGPRNRLQSKALNRLPQPVMDTAGKAVLKAVDQAVTHRWGRAVRLAAKQPGVTPEEKVRSIGRAFRRELAGVGAATGAVAAAPGIGTAAATGVVAADIGWFAMRTTDLIMAIGAAYGHTESTVEQRRAWVLSVMAFGEDAANEFASLLSELDSSVAIGGERVSGRLMSLAGTDAATIDALRRLNTNLANRVLTKYGSRRGMQSVGKLLPFGVGAVVGGTANYALVRATSKQAVAFFRSYGPQIGLTQNSRLVTPVAGLLDEGRRTPPMPGPEHRSN